MAEQKSYKDFPPMGLSEGRWHLADEPVDHTKTSSRRPHLQAYVKYMSPAVEFLIPKLWEKATKAVCLMFDKKGFKQVPEATFDYRVDEKAFHIFFKHVREDKELVAPSWPWQDEQFPEVDPNMKKSEAYSTYLAKKDRDASLGNTQRTGSSLSITNTMNSSQDIRDILDPTQDEAKIKTALLRHPPPWTRDADVGLPTRGIDCMIFLIRCFYCHMLLLYFPKNEENTANEGSNTLLRLAWLDVDQKHPDAIKEWTQQKKDIAVLFGVLGRPNPLLRVEQLITCQLMQDTLWSRPEYRLWRGRAVGSGTSWKLSQVPEEQMFDKSTIVVDRNKTPELTFQESIANFFRPQKLPDSDGLRELYMCAQPCVIRVKYNTKEGLEPLPFATIKNIKVPIASIIDSNPWFDRFPRYTLVAVLALKDDRIRTYAPLGEEIKPFPVTPITGGGDWSLEDDVSTSFMLFYIYVGEASPDERTAEFAAVPQDFEGYEIAENTLSKAMEMYGFNAGTGSNYK